MENILQIQLASDILKEHFGDVVERIGTCLLERGPLSLDQIVRFLGSSCTLVDAPPKWEQVRNAMLVLVQHSIVAAKPRPGIDVDTTTWKAVPMIYAIEIEEIFSRMRFPHFLEYARWVYGKAAHQLLFIVLQHGRASASFVIAEAHRGLQGESIRDLETSLRSLAAARIISPVGVISNSAVGQTAAPLQNVATLSPVGCPVDIEAPLKRARTDQLVSPDAEGDHDANGAACQTLGNSPSGNRHGEVVYRYDRASLTLCLCKNVLVRLVEERVNSHAAQVLCALFFTVGFEGDSGRVTSRHMQFAEIEKRMSEVVGGYQPGRDPNREREKLRKVLDLLSAHKDGLVVKRQVVAAPAVVSGVSAPSRARAQRAKVRSAASEQQFAAATDGAGDSLGTSQPPEQSLEWCIEWQAAKRAVSSAVASQLVRDQFGPVGLRIYNLLNEGHPPQKLEEGDIFTICMVPVGKGREILNAMVRRHIVLWQEVPKIAGLLVSSFWLFYIDRNRVQLALLEQVFQTVLNLRIRFRVESAKTARLESRVHGLSSQEREQLHAGRRTEDILERSFLMLDSAILTLRHF